MKVMVIEIKHYQSKITLIKLSHVYLKNIIKIQITMSINFISFKDTDQESAMHSKSGDIKIMVNDKPDEVIEKRFESQHPKYP